MLSQEEQRRLDEIERHLEESDPKLAAQLRPARGRRRRPVLFIVATMTALIIALLAVVAGWVAAAVGAGVELLAVTTFATAIHAARLSRSSVPDGENDR